MKKAVLKLDLHDDKAKKKAMMTVSGFPGVDSISIEMKDKKLTVTGDIDPVHIVAQLRKLCHTEIITVGPAKEPEKKKEEPEKKDPADPVKKAVLKLDLHDDKAKKKAMMTVSGFSGVDSISIEMKDKKLTVTGDIDPVHIVAKLRKQCHTEIITVGPAKEPEKKKEEPKKEEPKKKKEEPKKEEPKKEEPKKKKEEPMKKKEEKKKEEPKKKKEEPKKEEPKKKKEEPKKEEPKKKKRRAQERRAEEEKRRAHEEKRRAQERRAQEEKKKSPRKKSRRRKGKKDPADPVANYLSFHPQMPQYYYVSRVEDNQDTCVIF